MSIKSKVLIGSVICILAGSLVACSVKGISLKDTNNEYQYASLVQLPDYSYVTIPGNNKIVTDDDVKDYINENILKDTEVTDRGVVTGNKINVSLKLVGDVVGEDSLDNYDCTFGDEQLLPEIESAIEGMKAGETKHIAFTYGESADVELIGSSVEMDITLNAVYKENTYDNLTDENVFELTGYKTKTEFWNAMRLVVETQEAEEQQAAAMQIIVEELIEPAHISMSSTLLEDYYSYIYTSCMDTLCQALVDKNYREYKAATEGMTPYEYNNELKFTVINAVKEIAVYQAVAKEQGIVINDEDRDAAAEELYKEFKFESKEAFKKADEFGVLTQLTVLRKKIIEFLTDREIENDEVTEVNETERVTDKTMEQSSDDETITENIIETAEEKIEE